MRKWGAPQGAKVARLLTICVVAASATGAVVLAVSGTPGHTYPTATGALVRATISSTVPQVTAAGARIPATFGSSTQNRYTLVHGCYAIASPSNAPIAAANGPFRLQAAALGVYLLYTPGGRYLNAGLTVASTPTAASEWTVTGSGRTGFTMTGHAGSAIAVKFVPASGCATFPEAGVDASGQPFHGASPESDVLGTVDGHSHITAFEFFGGDWHCGRPWSPFGVVYALPYSCLKAEQGTNGVFEDLLDFGAAPRPTEFHGWPVFQGWPSPTALAEEGDYYTGIQRAWMAGLRLMVTNDVDNEALCSLMTTRTNPCNDMASVVIQRKDLYALQDYIDAQSGGPGKGWFRIVTDPFQARKVINQGKLAVVQGIEVSALFNCTERNNVPSCSDKQIDAGIKQVVGLGVRTLFPVHEFDNAFGGSKGIAGTTGLIVNAGNRLEAGSFWNMQPCPAVDADAEQTTAPDSGPIGAIINSSLVTNLTQGAPLPVYSPGPTCNTRGISSYGTYLIHQMIKNHLIIQTDHMDSKTAAAAIQIATAAHYSGIVSAHCCGSPQLYKSIYDTGGVVTEAAVPAASFIQTLKTDQAESDSEYKFGFGWGSDMNGLAEQPGPSSATPITYPFKAYEGNVTFTKEQWGERKFNLNTDGVANYGMYADYLKELQTIGGAPVMNAMFQGAESWLEMWERAEGVPATSCSHAGLKFSSHGLGTTFRLGDGTTNALYRAGQPTSRPDTTFFYCVAQSRRRVAMIFSKAGDVELIATNARDRTGSAAVGAKVRSESGLKLRPGLNIRGRYVYGVAKGRVIYEGVATRALLRHKAALKSAIQAAGL
jgi:hypothetical protein